MSPQELWQRYQKYWCNAASIDLCIDVSRMRFADDFFGKMQPAMERAYTAMEELESGAIANPDENRRVGHYWLRAPSMAPTAEDRAQIEDTVQTIRTFAADVHSGKIKPPTASTFTRVLSIGIGGSALGPQFVADALGNPRTDKMQMHFIDNTDPDGIARELDRLDGRLGETLCIVISKSGRTRETRNGLLVVQSAYQAAKLTFADHAVATTQPDSDLDKRAKSEGWRKRFAMFDWVGGRTSQLSSVGLLPAALQGLDIDGMLEGAADCDQVTRVRDTPNNPSALLALMWYHATGGKGRKDMVILPYKDRLLLFSRYLQQLVMESLGKRLDLDGKRVDQGIAVYGNKGSTDQHAYVQQLRDGVNNFFVTFIRVLESGGKRMEVASQVTAGDYLHGFLLGTREALFGNDRESITITVPRIDARTVGTLIALFERAVGFYATLVNINAYHQPGVQAGKEAATAVLELQRQALDQLSDSPQTAQQIADSIGQPDAAETVYLVLEHLAANGRAAVADAGEPARTSFCRVENQS